MAASGLFFCSIASMILMIASRQLATLASFVSKPLVLSRYSIVKEATKRDYRTRFLCGASQVSSIESSDVSESNLVSDHGDLSALQRRIDAKGDEIRQLKASGVSKENLAPYISELKTLKAQLPAIEPSLNLNSITKDVGNGKEKSMFDSQKHLGNTAKKTKIVEALSESELRANRLSKVSSMQAAGIEPYAYTYEVTDSAASLATRYNSRLDAGEEDIDADVAVAGRIMTRRVFGKLAFFTLQDETGIIQLQFDQSRLPESFQVSVGSFLLALQDCWLRIRRSKPTFLLFCLLDFLVNTASEGLD
jgi:hypothetical protein